VNIAIALGTYKLYDFVKLNLLQLQKIFPDSPIVLNDDKSERSEDIKKLAEEMGVAMSGSAIRRGHFAGDIQNYVSGLEFAQQEGADILLKLGQRFIPLLPIFRTYIEEPFLDPNIRILVPGRISAAGIRLPSSKWYSGFGILSDCVAIRVGSISPKEFLEAYTSNYKFSRFSPNLLVEVFLGQLLATVFQNSSFVSMNLANYKPGEHPAFLRKTQCDPRAYQALAETHGLTGGDYPCDEYAFLEKGGYLCRPCF
jgi:hypothetical protein